MKVQVYTDLQDEVISKEEFEEINRRFTEKLEAAEKKMQSLIETKQEALRNKPNLKPWIETFRKYQNIEELDRSIVVSLIDRIIVHDKDHITVVFHFQDEIQNVISLAGLDGEEVEQLCAQ